MTSVEQLDLQGFLVATMVVVARSNRLDVSAEGHKCP
jgi:hypothetical protein